MHINIHVERPVALLLVLSATFGALGWLMNGTQMPVSANLVGQVADTDIQTGEGGEGDAPQVVIHAAEDSIRQARAAHDLLVNREQILRYQIERISNERKLMQSDLTPELDAEFLSTLHQLSVLLEDKRNSEDQILRGFKEIWQAQESANAAAQIGKANPDIHLIWPVQPVYGVSATFDDPAYLKLFGIPHKAVDIPELQGTTIVAADTGVVEDAVDNGMGFSYIIVRHDGYSTLYGHVSEFYVAKGQHVMQGDPIGRTGGMPGTEGAGSLSTGPHLHFELITGEGKVNPLQYLPTSGVSVEK